MLKGAGATFLRVNLALLLAAAWTIPAGVAIGFHPRLARMAQPLAQIAASVPATALFPVLLLALVGWAAGWGGVDRADAAGDAVVHPVQCDCGGMAIPSDLKEVATLFRFSTLEQWRK